MDKNTNHRNNTSLEATMRMQSRDAQRAAKKSANIKDCRNEAEEAYDRAIESLQAIQAQLHIYREQARENCDNNKADWSITGSLQHIAHSLSETNI